MSLEKDTSEIKKLVEAKPIFKAATSQQIAKRPAPATRPFYIDFETWVIQAKDESDAFFRARKYIAAGVVPDIAQASDASDMDITDDRLGDFIKLRVSGKPELGGMGEIPVIEAKPVFKAASSHNLAKRKEERDKISPTDDTVITIETEYGIPISFLIEECLNKTYLDAQGDEEKVERMFVTSGFHLVKREIKSLIGELPIQLLLVKFNGTDSGNWSHGFALYYVKLMGKVKDLKQIANEDQNMYYDWEE